MPGRPGSIARNRLRAGKSNRGGSSGGRSDFLSALACGASFPYRVTARRAASGGSLCDPGNQCQGLYRNRSGDRELTQPSAPRALTTEEVRELVELYRQAARNAKEAGFDGVELHAANGYLINQFISEHTNVRTDEYGGSLENRLRFLQEVTRAVSDVFGSRNVGVRFAPLFSSTDEDRVYLGLVEPDPQLTYLSAAQMLNDMQIGYLSIAEPDWDNSPDLPETFRQSLRETFDAPILCAGRYTREKAMHILENGWADLFGFGRTFIANPDLPYRLQNNLPLNDTDVTSLYGGNAAGYTDYPVYRS